MELKSLKGCQLVIGSYPKFNYDARYGGGEAKIIPSESGIIDQIEFEPETFSIPPLTTKTTKFLSLPLPPGLKIEIRMKKLNGTINRASGEILLNFESSFIFTVGSLIKFPDLFIKTLLETGKVKGALHHAEGLKIQNDGMARLVGISVIQPSGNKILDRFLGLPNEALAILECKIE